MRQQPVRTGRSFSLTVLLIALGAMGHAQERGLTAATAEGAPVRPQKYGIIIGVNQYEDEAISDLKCAAQDAYALHEMLRSAPDGFAGAHTVLLADGQEKAPTRGTILRFLKSYVTLAGPEDTVLVYFAGHGTTVDDNLYLLPADASLSLVKDSAIAYSTVKAILEESPAKRKILLLDACHSGTGRSAQTMSQEALDRLERESKGMVILTSCGPEELSHEMANTGHGAFTHFLIKGLTGEADSNADGLIGASELSSYTWQQTRLWAAQQGLTQTPMRLVEKVAGEIVLARAGGAAPGPTTIPSAAAAGPGTGGPAKPHDLERFVGRWEHQDQFKGRIKHVITIAREGDSLSVKMEMTGSRWTHEVSDVEVDGEELLFRTEQIKKNLIGSDRNEKKWVCRLNARGDVLEAESRRTGGNMGYIGNTINWTFDRVADP
ncbi:MAG: caspase family protein [Candidatus Hydrogenedentes bacterium]|nr:caspase family protein [Candidatus Hydrogenedentota bacterium]